MDEKNTPESPQPEIALWTRTTVVIREESLKKLKFLALWENTTLKDIFHDMIQQYLSSKNHIDRLIEENKSSRKYTD